ncbi:MAG TPA: AraC family transcriptional regulator [Candidatus Mediterraneibacter cottocaccae]|nr:AraC family transcriptional regulator [Candidatus Mediterraneibacter cottocaccae]
MAYQGIALKDELHIEELFSLHYFEYMNSFFFPGESHDFWEFVCVDKGEVTIGADEKTHVLKRGQIAFHKPGEFHWVKAGGGIAPNLVVVSFSCTGSLMDFFQDRILQIDEAERRLLAKVVMEAGYFLEGRLDNPYQTTLFANPSAPPASGQLIRLYLEQLILSLYRRFHAESDGAERSSLESGIPLSAGSGRHGGALEKTIKENVDAELFAQITAYLERNLSAHVTIEKICRENLVGRSRLQKLFQEQTHMGIIEYFSKMKIDAARQMIRSEQMNFTQISEKLGYSSIHYFSRQFKKVTGMTPSEYASSIRAMAEKR